MCAMKAISKYSKKPAESVNVEELLKEWGTEAPKSRRVFDEDDMKIAMRLANILAERVDAIQEAS